MKLHTQFLVTIGALFFCSITAANCLNWLEHVRDGDFGTKTLPDGEKVDLINGGMHSDQSFQNFRDSYPTGYWEIEEVDSLENLRGNQSLITGKKIILVRHGNGVIVRQIPTDGFGNRGKFNSASAIIGSKRYAGLKTQFPENFPFNDETFLKNFEKKFTDAPFPLNEDHALKVDGGDFIFTKLGKGGKGMWKGGMIYLGTDGETTTVNVTVAVTKYGGSTGGSQKWDVNSMFPNPVQP